jgi:hypothetical protein
VWLIRHSFLFPAHLWRQRSHLLRFHLECQLVRVILTNSHRLIIRSLTDILPGNSAASENEPFTGGSRSYKCLDMAFGNVSNVNKVGSFDPFICTEPSCCSACNCAEKVGSRTLLMKMIDVISRRFLVGKDRIKR